MFKVIVLGVVGIIFFILFDCGWEKMEFNDRAIYKYNRRLINGVLELGKLNLR